MISFGKKNNVGTVVSSVKGLDSNGRVHGVVDVKEFGAKGDGVADDTVAIENASEFLSQNGGGKLIIPEGTFVATYIKIKKDVQIEGQGYATILKYANNTNTDAFIYLEDAQVSHAGISNLLIDGNKANNTTNISSGIKIDGSAYVRPDNTTPDNNINCSDLWILNCSKHGLYIYGARESRFTNIMVAGCKDKGMLLGGSDNVYDNCTSYWNDGIGVHFTGPNNRISNLKAFGNKGSAGIYFDATGIDNMGINIEAQENYGHGIMIGDTSGITLLNVLVDSNSYTTPNTSYGVHIYNSDKIIIMGYATDFHKKNNDGQWYQKAGINLYNATNYHVVMTSEYQMTSNYIAETRSMSNSGILIINGVNVKNSLTKISDDFFRLTNKWNGTALLSGTADMSSGSPKHPGTIRYSSSTSANSGYNYSSDLGIYLGGGEKTTLIFKTANSLTNILRRFGFLDTNDHTSPTNGVYIKILNGVLSGNCIVGGTSVYTATNYTLSTLSWYRLKIEINYNATLATFTLYADDSDTVLWTDTLATNIPPSTTALKHSDICTYSGTSIIDLGYVDYMDIYLPLARKVE